MEGGEGEEKNTFLSFSSPPPLYCSSIVGRAAVSSFTAQETSAAEQSCQGLLAKGKVCIPPPPPPNPPPLSPAHSHILVSEPYLRRRSGKQAWVEVYTAPGVLGWKCTVRPVWRRTSGLAFD